MRQQRETATSRKATDNPTSGNLLLFRTNLVSSFVLTGFASDETRLKHPKGKLPRTKPSEFEIVSSQMDKNEHIAYFVYLKKTLARRSTVHTSTVGMQ